MAKKETKSSSKLDVAGQSDDQLNESLAELKREAFNLRFQAATSQLEKPSRVREVRRDIARIKTQQSARAKASAAAK
ncbi:MAG: 50S ribosomal protein L29 [Sphingomonas sp.]|uniref:50S ribosomal protein L29 n=1 Tax=Sphingomonas sp. TaxID=28214 RepID=UPI001225D7E2|nr:50S ribosomal protein L29 [Sphingomonas sp.]THD35369.1 MAG: 50S ribosomal protein L29 [Sphingomonas sp.]